MATNSLARRKQISCAQLHPRSLLHPPPNPPSAVRQHRPKPPSCPFICVYQSIFSHSFELSAAAHSFAHALRTLEFSAYQPGRRIDLQLVDTPRIPINNTDTHAATGLFFLCQPCALHCIALLRCDRPICPCPVSASSRCCIRVACIFPSTSAETARDETENSLRRSTGLFFFFYQAGREQFLTSRSP